ncbi:MAG: helix-turn-helix transcriptional regulator [Chloroflexi bacterium SZAS-1]|nr:helix-turn-helix transcriptional regulator [Chloroflexi bacterium SZAS-1]
MIRTMPATGASAHSSYILHERAAEYYGAGTGYLSIKSFFGGRALYAVGRARFAIDERSYLVLNHGREYSITIESQAPVESLCVFFAPGMAAATRRTLATPSAQLLNNPEQPSAPDQPFFERSYAQGDGISHILLRIRHALGNGYAETGWLHEQLHALMAALLQQQHTIYREIERLPAARPATREELYRRLHLAREFAAACFAAPLTLEALADVAGMSSNHLLRTFKQVFGQTPYQYITAQRIAAAQQQLAHTDNPISEICLAVGFESLGAFSWLFRRHNGMPPSAYRHQFR